VIDVDVADENGYTIWLVQADGSGSTVLTNGFDAHWSPDANRIMFLRGFGAYVRELGTGAEAKIADAEMLMIAWYP